MPTTISRKKLEANRRNARLSTGPKTAAGQRKARWNALKHGLLAAETIIAAGEGQERREDFERLLGQLRRDLRPQSALEEMLVEKVAVCYWRLRRLLRYETGQIRKDLDTAGSQSADEKLRQLDLAHTFSAAGLPLARQKLRQSSLGLQYLIEQLEKMRQEVETTDTLSEKTSERLIKFFGPGELDFPARLQSVGKQNWPQDLMEALTEEKARLEQLKPQVEQQEELQQQSHRARLSLPDKQATEHLVRYQNSLEHQLDRTLRQLQSVRTKKKRK